MSSLPYQLIGLIAFLSIFIFFNNALANEATYYTGTLNNGSLISGESYQIQFINDTTVSQEADNLFDTIKDLATFQIQDQPYLISLIFYLASIWLIVVIYLLVHPLK